MVVSIQYVCMHVCLYGIRLSYGIQYVCIYVCMYGMVWYGIVLGFRMVFSMYVCMYVCM